MRRAGGKIRKTEGDQCNMAPMGVIIMVYQNSEVRRMLNATTVVRKDTSRKSLGVAKRENMTKNLSHQMLRGV